MANVAGDGRRPHRSLVVYGRYRGAHRRAREPTEATRIVQEEVVTRVLKLASTLTSALLRGGFNEFTIPGYFGRWKRRHVCVTARTKSS